MKRAVRRTLSFTLASAMIIGSAAGFSGMEARAEESEENIQQQFWVAVDGSDDNDGSKEHPFATVERARRAVDEINNDMTGNIIVNIGAGDYYLDDTLVLGPDDSGTNGYEVIYRSSDGIGAANLIGGERIDGWELADKTDVSEYDLDETLLGKVYKTQLDPEQYEFNTLYVNDERAVMARTRNRDNHPNFPMAKGEYMRSAGGHNNDLNMIYNAGDIDQKAIDGMVHAQERGEKEIAQVFVWDGGSWDWFTNTVPIATIDVEKNEFKFPTPPEDYPEKYRTKYNIGSGARYFLQGNLAFMDVEGEYHYNKSTGVLYYYPKEEDGAIEDQTIVVPTMQIAVHFKGADKENLADEPDPDKQVHNITFDGLAVKDTEFADYFTYSWNWGDAGAGIGYFPEAAEGSTNPSFCETEDRPEFRVGSITLDGTHDITITNTRVKNSGMYGIIYANDNQYSVLTDSVVENTGYGGVIFDGGYPAIGKYNNHNKVENVLIHEVGELVGHAVGLTLMSSGENTFKNMEIYDTPKRAILVIGGFRRDRNGGDKNYDELRDMYTVGNHFDYIHVHDAQQDAGEDSAVFLSWLLAGKDVRRLHGSNDPNDPNLTNMEGIEKKDRYNYFNQMLITDVGADPSVIEKCTVNGLDTAMGATGSTFTNVRAANTQMRLLAIRDQSQGDGYGDMYNYENCTNDEYGDDQLKTFDDSKMEYDKIGLTDSFPEEYRVAKRTYPEPPEDIYFSDDFEGSSNLDLRKWTVEKGYVEMYVGRAHMSEDPTVGKCSLPINTDTNKSGVVVSRTFENDLNKIVEVKYLDRRKDYATADPARTANSFLRVDDGENALGLGAATDVSKDYYVIKKGGELIQTDVKRFFGWHTLKFDYSSGTDVKLYIDDQLVATYDESDGVATSFNYIAMGDWEGKGGRAFFDQLYVYGGQDAPPAEDLPLPTPPEAPDETLFAEDFESDSPAEFVPAKGKATVEVAAEEGNESNTVMYVVSSDDTVYYPDGMDWSNYQFECKVKILNWGVDGSASWDNMAPGWYLSSPDGNKNYNRYTVKYNRQNKNFSLYRRSGGDSELMSSAAPENYEGVWHDYKIQTLNGLITVYVDGEKIFEREDSSNQGGTIGFDGIHVEYLVDDISVTRQKTPNPSADIEEGTYEEPVSVLLIPADSGQDVFYTLDGTDPTDPAHGQYYIQDEPLVIEETTTVKFAAIMDGGLYSDVIEKTYTIGEAEKPADKSQLEALYNECKAIEEDKYTGGSWAAFDAARTAAAEVLAKEDATQEEVDQALEALRSAKDALEEKGDKTLLQKAYDYAVEQSTDGVVDSAREFFEKVKTEAKAVLDNPDATQAEINSALDNLCEGIFGLGIVEGDKTMLEMLIERAEAMAEEADRYVETNWQQLTGALAAAKETAADGDALQEEVDKATDALFDAILAQRYKANKDNLQRLVDSLADIDLSKYTEESVQVFTAAMAQANVILADNTLSVDDQAKVDAAVEELEAARDGLVEKTDDSGDGDTDDGNTGDGNTDDGNTGDGNTDDGNTGDGNTDDGNTGDGNTGDVNTDEGNTGNSGTSADDSDDGNGTEDETVENKAVQTGDSTNIALIVAVMIAAIAAGGIAVAGKRRKF